MKQFTINTDEDEITLDRWVKRNLPHIGKGKREQGFRKGWIKLEGTRSKGDVIVRSGHVISVAPSLAEPSPNQKLKKTPAPVIINAEETRWVDAAILYENADLIAVNKPAGIPVQGGSKQRVSVDRVMNVWAQEKGYTPRLVHRLDKDTSGVLLLAKTAQAATGLTKAFAAYDIEKCYTALVKGVPKVKKGVITDAIKKGEDGQGEKMMLDEDGKKAETHYEVTEAYANKLSWVSLWPKTGRTHQLRVHMASHQHPIVGDGKYGGREAFVRGIDIEERLHLHAASITFEWKGETLTIEAPLSDHMAKAQKILAG